MWHRFIRSLRGIPLIAFIIRVCKWVSLPGFEKVPIADVASFFWQSMIKGTITMRASAVSFSFFLALFPTIIFLFTLIPYIPIDNFQEQLMSLLKSFMPHNAYQATEDTIFDIVTNQRGGLLSIGFLSAMYFSTNGFDALITAFNNTYHDIEVRSAVQQRLVSILLVVIFTVLLTLAISLIIFSEYLLHRIFHEGGFTYFMVVTGRILILFGLIYSLISCTFYLGPSRRHGWKFFSAGSMLATILSIVTSVGFAYYVNNFGTYNKLYGSIGTLIVVLLWIYFNALVVLMGFDLNASIRQAKKNKNSSLKSNAV